MLGREGPYLLFRTIGHFVFIMTNNPVSEIFSATYVNLVQTLIDWWLYSCAPQILNELNFSPIIIQKSLYVQI